jgi:hypothetical protein
MIRAYLISTWTGEFLRAHGCSTAILAVGPTGILPVDCNTK